MAPPRRTGSGAGSVVGGRKGSTPDILSARPGSVSSGRNDPASAASTGTLPRKTSAPALGSMTGRPLPPTPGVAAASPDGQQQQRPILGRSVSLATPPAASTPPTAISEPQQQPLQQERRMSTASQPPVHLVDKQQQQQTPSPQVQQQQMQFPFPGQMVPPQQQRIPYQQQQVRI